MPQRLIYLAALIALNVHSLFTMPSWRPDTWDRLADMALRDFAVIEPYAYSVFVLYGMWSLLMAMLVVLDGRYQRFPGWPFALSTMVLGPSMIFLYQAFRRHDLEPFRQRNRLEEFAGSRLLAIVIVAIALAALWDGRAGDLHNLLLLFRTDYLTHAMLVDEALFLVLTPILVSQDLARSQRRRAWVWVALLVPFVGACAYLATREREGDAGGIQQGSESSADRSRRADGTEATGWRGAPLRRAPGAADRLQRSRTDDPAP